MTASFRTVAAPTEVIEVTTSGGRYGPIMVGSGGLVMAIMKIHAAAYVHKEMQKHACM